MKAMNLIGMLMTLLVLSGKVLGVSPSLRYMYAATVPGNVACLQYDWWRYGGLNLLFVAGILLGGVVAGIWLHNGKSITLAAATEADLATPRLATTGRYAPEQLFWWLALATVSGFVAMVVGVFWGRCTLCMQLYIWVRYHGHGGAAGALTDRHHGIAHR